MVGQNTWPCRGCGKPFIEENARKQHEYRCPPATPEEYDTTDTEEAESEDQDTHREPAPNPQPEPATPPPVPEDPPEPEGFQQDPCRCCSADVDTNRQGLCHGCGLAGCEPDSDGCQHRGGGS